MIKFSIWLEQKNDYIKDAILGIIKASNLSDKNKDNLLRTNTGELDNNTLRELQKLGIIRSIADTNPNKYIDIINSIRKGNINLLELIEKIQGKTLAPKAVIK
jgi:hypothetical protein